MIITFLIPNLLMKKGIVRMKSVSEICEMDKSKIGCVTPNVPGCVVLKLSRNDPPKALVICKAAPKPIANKKKINIFFCFKSTKASRPIFAAREPCDFELSGLHGGIVNEYNPNTRAEHEPKISCMLLDFHPKKSTIHMAAIKPIVPHTRIGGKTFTIS